MRFSITTILILTGCIGAAIFWFSPGTGVHVPHYVLMNDAAFAPAAERFSNFSERLEWEEQMWKYDYVPKWASVGVLPSEPPEYIDFDREDMLVLPVKSPDLACDATTRCLGRLTIIHGERLNEGTCSQEIAVPKSSVVTYRSQWTLWGIDGVVALLLVGTVGVSYRRDRNVSIG